MQIFSPVELEKMHNFLTEIGQWRQYYTPGEYGLGRPESVMCILHIFRFPLFSRDFIILYPMLILSFAPTMPPGSCIFIASFCIFCIFIAPFCIATGLAF